MSGLCAIQDCIDESDREEEFTKENLEIAILEPGKPFKYLTDEEKGAFLPKMKGVSLVLIFQ